MKYENKIDLVANEYQCISFASIEPKIDKLASKRDFITFLGLLTVVLITIETTCFSLLRCLVAF